MVNDRECYLCYTHLMDYSKQVGAYEICHTCYGKLVFEIVMEIGIDQMMENKLAEKSWERYFEEKP